MPLPSFSTVPPPPEQAFVLGAGLGTRLRPLTETLPKPLIPIAGRPLIEFAFDRLIDGGVRRLIVNTHHQAEAYARQFPGDSYRGIPLRFRHEPILLETGGGIRNIRDLLQEGPFWVFNGDVLSTIPLQRAWESHVRNSNLATLVLRSSGGPLQVAFDPDTEKVTDIRQSLKRAPGTHLFTGIYVVEPALADRIPAEKKISIVETFLEEIAGEGRIGAVVEDGGIWQDIGTVESCFAVHQPGAVPPGLLPTLPFIHPQASVHPTARLEGASWVGPQGRVEAGAHLIDSMIWADAVVSANTRLDHCIVRSGQAANTDAANQIW